MFLPSTYVPAPALPALQLRDLNEIAAGVLDHRNGRGGHVGWWHGELGSACLDPRVVALKIVGQEHSRGLVLLKDRLRVRCGCGNVVERQLQLRDVQRIGRGYGQPALW